MADQKAPKQRKPKEGHRLTITLSDEHYQAIVAKAKADDREPNVFVSRAVRNNFDTLFGA